jgi:plasmid stabilization system protein ParE
MTIRVSTQARREFEEARRYYEDRQSGLGEQFRDAFQAQVKRMKLSPDVFPQVHLGVRRCVGNRFPYDVIFQRITSDLILILAVAHQRRHPEYWLGRIKRL